MVALKIGRFRPPTVNLRLLAREP